LETKTLFGTHDVHTPNYRQKLVTTSDRQAALPKVIHLITISDGQAMDDFCFIVGSFAQNDGRLIRKTSDIDILVNEGFSEKRIRHLLFQRYPQLDRNTPLDISYRIPTNGMITFKTAYWQADKFIPLIPSIVELVLVRTPPDVPNCLRDPNKQTFIDYVTTSEIIDFHYVAGLPKSIRHYGEFDFWCIIDSLPEKKLFIEAYSLILVKYPGKVRINRKENCLEFY
jgi:hypothetical protein